MNKKESPVFEFLMFLICWGWVGPLSLFFGIRQEDSGIIVVGILFTYFFWFFLGGLELLKNLILTFKK
jgi:hypothetical protein